MNRKDYLTGKYVWSAGDVLILKTASASADPEETTGPPTGQGPEPNRRKRA